jgi:hypothetical protein
VTFFVKSPALARVPLKLASTLQSPISEPYSAIGM